MSCSENDTGIISLKNIKCDVFGTFAYEETGAQPQWQQMFGLEFPVLFLRHQSSGIQPGVILLPRRYLEMSGDIFSCHNWGRRRMLLVFPGLRTGLLPNILQCTGWSPQPRSFQPQMSIVLRLRALP